MTLAGLLGVATFAQAWLGLVALLMADAVPLGLTLVGATALGLGCLGIWTGKHRLGGWLGEGGWHAALLLTIVVFGVDLLVISKDLLSASIHLLVLLMSCRALKLEGGKDFLQLAAMSFMALVATAAFANAIWFGAVAILYLLVSVWMLVLFHLFGEAQDPVATDIRQIGRLAGGRFFWVTNVTAITVLGVSVLVFVMIPRVGAGFFQKNRSDAIRMSGFSTSVEPGDLQPVRRDSTIVMRVRILEGQDEATPRREAFYMRGMVYDHYDGRTWANRFKPRDVPQVGGAFHVRSSADAPDIRQEVVLQPIGTKVLFGIPSVRAVRGSFQSLSTDAAGVLYVDHPSYRPLAYTAQSVERRVAPAERRRSEFDYPAEVRRTYTDLPELDPRVAALARLVAAGASTPYQAVQAIKRYLERNYAYSLEAKAEAGLRSPVEAFLFTWKTGYCEHFATAMTVLARAVGIPARLATGFLGGEWNEFGGYQAFRQRDAHAWAEVYFPQSGWVIVDATPPAGADDASVWSTVTRMVDWVQYSWNRYIIEYSMQDQVAMARGVQDWAGRLTSAGRSWQASLAEWISRFKQAGVRIMDTYSSSRLLLVALAGGIGLGAVGLLVHKVWKQIGTMGLIAGRGIRRRHSSLGKGAWLYRRMLAHLASQGLVKAPHVTPWEFHAQVSREWREVEPLVRRLTTWYCRVRYGGAGVSGGGLAEAETWLRQLRGIRKRRRSIWPTRSIG